MIPVKPTGEVDYAYSFLQERSKLQQSHDWRSQYSYMMGFVPDTVKSGD